MAWEIKICLAHPYENKSEISGFCLAWSLNIKGKASTARWCLKQYFQDQYNRYDEYEINWIGDFNPTMINVVKQVGGDECKRHATYRKLFNNTKPFRTTPDSAVKVDFFSFVEIFRMC